jgi:glycosyltransferase involved in cell wall biosynthesis
VTARWQDDNRIDDEASRAFAEHFGTRATQLPPLAIVIAAYNEEGAIGPVIDSLPRPVSGLDVAKIVVSDGSVDATVKEAEEAGALVCEVGANRGQGAKPNRQASLVVDPPDGRIPALTAEAQKLAADRAAARRVRPCSTTAGGCHDSWEDESLWDRCITRGTVGSIVPNTYNQGNQILQTPGTVVLRNEMIHETRIIPVDGPVVGRPHVSSNIRTWMGDSRGHWEGNTLVVETTNFKDGTVVGNTPATENLRLIERFTRVDANTLKYQVTIDDPKTWTQPWTISFPLRNEPNYVLYEYACHEGNYYMYNALKGARAEEAKKGLK